MNGEWGCDYDWAGQPASGPSSTAGALARIEAGCCPSCGRAATRTGEWMRCEGSGWARPTFGPVEFRAVRNRITFRHWPEKVDEMNAAREQRRTA